ncbi:MAG: hypothetical protein WC890_07380 [Candidatus Margulisiibacteriota bacterium]
MNKVSRLLSLAVNSPKHDPFKTMQAIREAKPSGHFIKRAIAKLQPNCLVELRALRNVRIQMRGDGLTDAAIKAFLRGENNISSCCIHPAIRPEMSTDGDWEAIFYSFLNGLFSRIILAQDRNNGTQGCLLIGADFYQPRVPRKHLTPQDLMSGLFVGDADDIGEVFGKHRIAIRLPKDKLGDRPVEKYFPFDSSPHPCTIRQDLYPQLPRNLALTLIHQLSDVAYMNLLIFARHVLANLPKKPPLYDAMSEATRLSSVHRCTRNILFYQLGGDGDPITYDIFNGIIQRALHDLPSGN